MSRILKKLASFVAKAILRRLQSRVMKGRAPALVRVSRHRGRGGWR